jgi:ferredoxin
MIAMFAWTPVVAYVRPLRTHIRATVHVSMCEPDIDAPPGIDVSGAADEASKMLDEEQHLSRMAALFDAPPAYCEGMEKDSDPSLAYIANRDTYVGKVDSSQLLDLDEAAGVWPEENLPKGDPETAQDMFWVDELSCIGCRWCADVARSTFRIESEYGTARVFQQGGDTPDTVQEAIDCCPADCIVKCTRQELDLLEEHRSHGYMDDLQARHSIHRRLMGEGDGGGSMAAPHWRDPITHQGWRKGDKYIKTRRLKLEDPLLHKSGEKSSMSLIGLHKVNEAPSPEFQDGHVIPADAPSPTDTV